MRRGGPAAQIALAKEFRMCGIASVVAGVKRAALRRHVEESLPGAAYNGFDAVAFGAVILPPESPP